MAATLYSDHVLGSTRMLKDFLQESNGIASAKSRTASFKALAIRAVKRISFPILPRSLSRRLSRKRERDEREIGGDFVVKIKDIIRWRSFRDLVDETAAAALDFADSPDFYTAAATTTTTTTATSSKSSSWCESDFTAEDSPSQSWSWRGCSGDGDGPEKYFPCVGEDSTEATTAHAEDDKKEALSRCNDEEEETLLKERARRLLEHVDAAISFSESCSTEERRPDRLLLQLFRRELRDCRESEMDEEDRKRNCLLVKGKEGYVREMERGGKWSMFCDEEKVELGLEFERGILGSLLDELLFDIFQF